MTPVSLLAQNRFTGALAGGPSKLLWGSSPPHPSLSGSGCSPGPPLRGREAAAAPPGVPGRAAEGARAAAACRWGSGSTNRLLLPKTASARRPPPLCLLPGKAARRGCGSRPRLPSFFTARALLTRSCGRGPAPSTPRTLGSFPLRRAERAPRPHAGLSPGGSWPSPPEQPPAALLWRRDPGNFRSSSSPRPALNKDLLIPRGFYIFREI